MVLVRRTPMSSCIGCATAPPASVPPVARDHLMSTLTIDWLRDGTGGRGVTCEGLSGGRATTAPRSGARSGVRSGVRSGAAPLASPRSRREALKPCRSSPSAARFSRISLWAFSATWRRRSSRPSIPDMRGTRGLICGRHDCRRSRDAPREPRGGAAPSGRGIFATLNFMGFMKPFFGPFRAGVLFDRQLPAVPPAGTMVHSVMLVPMPDPPLPGRRVLKLLEVPRASAMASAADPPRRLEPA
mmetsp:Transcript_90962/g.257617  ORF Transcript_90962/g.257617 Transcript_90962/m.257617 type:complete len:243 (+) Transcript_90962:187-915(+)